MDVSDFGKPCKFLVSLCHCLIRCVCESLVHDPVAQQYYPKIMLTKAKKKKRKGNGNSNCKSYYEPLVFSSTFGDRPDRSFIQVNMKHADQNQTEKHTKHTQTQIFTLFPKKWVSPWAADFNMRGDSKGFTHTKTYAEYPLISSSPSQLSTFLL